MAISITLVNGHKLRRGHRYAYKVTGTEIPDVPDYVRFVHSSTAETLDITTFTKDSATQCRISGIIPRTQRRGIYNLVLCSGATISTISKCFRLAN